MEERESNDTLQMFREINAILKEVEAAGEIEGLSKSEILQDYFVEIVKNFNVRNIEADEDKIRIKFDRMNLKGKTAAKLNIFLKEKISLKENYVTVAKDGKGGINSFTIRIPKEVVNSPSALGKFKSRLSNKEKHIPIHVDKNSVEIPYSLLSSDNMLETLSKIVDILQ